MTKKRILVLAALFPPEILGGAEMSALNLTRWLAARGYEVAVLATASAPDKVVHGEMIDGIRQWRVWMPRRYAMLNFPAAPRHQKPTWHLQDHFDPRNARIMSRVLDEFRPDMVNIHIVQGLGYNALAEIAARDLPTVFFLHDLGLGCVRMSMFKDGHDCATQCGVCKLSAAYKSMQLHKFRRVGLCSPSHANLRRLEQVFPVADFPNVSILNANRYPAPTIERAPRSKVHFVYVGRLHHAKGIQVLLEAAEGLASRCDFQMTVIGTGPDEETLRTKYASAGWCDFRGFITQSEISNIMVNADLMCIPSIWLENSPGVVVHALGLGLPVAGSDRGGIPELIKDDHNGALVPVGDVARWRRTLEQAILDPNRLDRWRRNAAADRERFDQQAIGAEIEGFMNRIATT